MGLGKELGTGMAWAKLLVSSSLRSFHPFVSSMPKKAGPRQERFSEFPLYSSHAIFFPGFLSDPAFENPLPLPYPQEFFLSLFPG